MTKTVAVMQPYFFPYGGYFSLIRAVDHFVLFDCVQFPRRGWVHRNKVPGPGGGEEWLTLPLARQPQDVLIRDLRFADDADARLAERLRRYPWLSSPGSADGASIRDRLAAPLLMPLDLLASTLRMSAEILGVNTEFSFSSALDLDASLRGQERVIAAARAVGGTRYVNSSGGRQMYTADAFRRHALELMFLPPYQGPAWSMLYRLCSEEPGELAREIELNSRPEAA